MNETARRISDIRQKLEHGASMRSCAWCGKIFVAEEWIPPAELPAAVRSLLAELHWTHGICPVCASNQARSELPAHREQLQELQQQLREIRRQLAEITVGDTE